MDAPLRWRHVATPLGALVLEQVGDALTRLAVLEAAPAAPSCSSPLLEEAASQIAAYFSGRLSRFELPLAVPATPFQHCVFEAMFAIPRGETRSYARIAHQLETSPRAIGQACAANRLPVLIPCHRIVGGAGVGGWSGPGGVEGKRRLLALEAAGIF